MTSLGTYTLRKRWISCGFCQRPKWLEQFLPSILSCSYPHMRALCIRECVGKFAVRQANSFRHKEQNHITVCGRRRKTPPASTAPAPQRCDVKHAQAANMYVWVVYRKFKAQRLNFTALSLMARKFKCALQRILTKEGRRREQKREKVLSKRERRESDKKWHIWPLMEPHLAKGASLSFAARSPRRSESVCVIYAVRGPIIGRDDFAAVQFMAGVIATGRNSGCKRWSPP